MSDREFRVHDKSHQSQRAIEYRDNQYNCKERLEWHGCFHFEIRVILLRTPAKIILFTWELQLVLASTAITLPDGLIFRYCLNIV
ncbi:hypothetical protein VN97_g6553 [Penicillium thymicola]|uniref:Uncharacterized protein n=1 Tax=Penicillium thymicola TaxID=293382 RepID=A0AAI9X7D6_PENTH|nr:hypothetical protein VN97_g6553 [Penicillium thymicola]